MAVQSVHDKEPVKVWSDRLHAICVAATAGEGYRHLRKINYGSPSEKREEAELRRSEFATREKTEKTRTYESENPSTRYKSSKDQMASGMPSSHAGVSNMDRYCCP